MNLLTINVNFAIIIESLLYVVFKLFNPNILFSSIYKVILKNDIPKENTSDNSGLNSPVLIPFDISNNSGDI